MYVHVYIALSVHRAQSRGLLLSVCVYVHVYIPLSVHRAQSRGLLLSVCVYVHVYIQCTFDVYTEHRAEGYCYLFVCLSVCVGRGMDYWDLFVCLCVPLPCVGRVERYCYWFVGQKCAKHIVI